MIYVLNRLINIYLNENDFIDWWKWLVGKNILESFLSEKYIIDAPSSRELNVADDKSVAQYFASHHPDVVIHAAVKPGHRNAPDFNNYFSLIPECFSIWSVIRINMKKC